ncbi:MAG: DUF2062 domain-containing protein [Bacteroidales bacterium]|nr:DUF2062 domain-containing protein [Bacteroidales bacterium]
MTPEICQTELQALRCCVVIPTYNNERTIESVIAEVHRYAKDILVVNDGSTDTTHARLANRTDIKLIEYPDAMNRGKGYALRTAMSEAQKMGFKYAITIDADGQHFADDIPTFVEAIKEHPNCLIIGARNLRSDGMPQKNTFANKFSNFWFKVDTGQTLNDTQSGFRLYPLDKMNGLRLFSPRYEFEVEVIVRMAWRDVQVLNVPIKVIYPEDRVTQFRPLRDFGRISILNTILLCGALLWFYPRKIAQLLRPKNFVRFIDRHLIHSHESNFSLAASVGVGCMFSVMPIWGFQLVAALAIAYILKLNKLLVAIFSNLSQVPLIPFIIFTSLWIGGKMLNRPTLISIENADMQAVGDSLLQYVLGGIALAIAIGITSTLFTYAILRIFRKS